MIYARIAGTGSYLPEKILTNKDLEQFVETNDEWIAERTGIRQRHVAAEGQTTCDLAYEAALKAMEAAGVTAAEVDLIVVGTTTPDLIFPSTISSISEGSTPAASSARRAAPSARSTVVSPSAAIWRWRIPVRAAIHSSLVSIRCARSSLVTTMAGR